MLMANYVLTYIKKIMDQIFFSRRSKNWNRRNKFENIISGVHKPIMLVPLQEGQLLPMAQAIIGLRR